MSSSTTPTCHTRRSKDGRPLTKCIFLKVPRCQNNLNQPETLQGKQGENRIWLNDAIPVSPKRELSQSIQRKPIPPNGNYRSKRRRAQKTNCLIFRNVTQNQVHNHPSNAIPSEEIPNSNRKIDLSRQLRTQPCISKTNCRVLVHKTPECLGRMHGDQTGFLAIPASQSAASVTAVLSSFVTDRPAAKSASCSGQLRSISDAVAGERRWRLV